MATENEAGKEVEVEETLDLPEVKEGEEDKTDYKAEALKLRDKAIAQRERTKSYKAKLAEKDAAIAALAGTKKEPGAKTGELDETQLDFLDVKGYTEAEDIKIIERHVQRTGETVRQALKDEYVMSKLEANKQTREVKNATPSSTKRGGNQTNDIASAIAKFEQSGVLPTDFALKTAVVNAIAEKGNSNKPSWH